MQRKACPTQSSSAADSFAYADFSFGAVRPHGYDDPEPFTDEVHTMSESPCFSTRTAAAAPANFAPRVVEPAEADAPDGLGLALELTLVQPVDGIAGRALRIHLRRGARMEQAETLRDLLHQVGADIVVS